jgi:hypothetical protein
MPRHDWNRVTAHTQKPHHRRMKSGAKGKGHDHYIRAAKQKVSQGTSQAQRAKTRKLADAEKKRKNNGTVGSPVHGDTGGSSFL